MFRSSYGLSRWNLKAGTWQTTRHMGHWSHRLELWHFWIQKNRRCHGCFAWRDRSLQGFTGGQGKQPLGAIIYVELYCWQTFKWGHCPWLCRHDRPTGCWFLPATRLKICKCLEKVTQYLYQICIDLLSIEPKPMKIMRMYSIPRTLSRLRDQIIQNPWM